VGPQQPPLDVDIERVPQVARRVVGRDVEHLEVGEVVLDLRALVGHEPELLEDLGDLAHRLDARVQRAAVDGPAGRGDVDRLGGQARLELRAPERAAALAERTLDRLADRVGDGADLGPILSRQRADPAQHRREPALLAQDVKLEGLESRDIGGGLDRRECLRPEGLQIAGQVGEVHVFLKNHEPPIAPDRGSLRLSNVR
jgi:hypothetical protein